MTTTRMPDDKLWVALQPPQAFVCVAGRATFKVSTSLKQFGLSAVESGCRTLLFDMADCTGMDSTFMGVLAGIALRLHKQEGEMVLLNLNTRTRGLVATLGLDHVVGAFIVGQTPARLQALAEVSRRMTTLASAPENKQDVARTMLEAHEQLVAIDPANQPRFKDVLTFLREDLKPSGSKSG